MVQHSGSGGGTGSGSGSSASLSGKTAITKTAITYSGTPVTTSAYSELVASLSDSVTRIHVFHGNDKYLVLAFGGAGSEVDQVYIPPGGDTLDLAIPSGTRVSVKAVDANATTGVLLVNFLK